MKVRKKGKATEYNDDVSVICMNCPESVAIVFAEYEKLT